MANGTVTRGRAGSWTAAQVRYALCEAFEQLGGIPALVQWGHKNPNLFYTLWAKMLPAEAAAEARAANTDPSETQRAIVVPLKDVANLPEGSRRAMVIPLVKEPAPEIVIDSLQDVQRG